MDERKRCWDYKRKYRKAHPLYSTWTTIKQRCFNPRCKDYLYYGARGITLFPPWIHDFLSFEAWMTEHVGPRPKGHTLDRIDNDGDYEPGNLRWADQSTQNFNRRRWCVDA
jgi:hypothetical protein